MFSIFSITAKRLLLFILCYVTARPQPPLCCCWLVKLYAHLVTLSEVRAEHGGRELSKKEHKVNTKCQLKDMAVCRHTDTHTLGHSTPPHVPQGDVKLISS